MWPDQLARVIRDAFDIAPEFAVIGAYGFYIFIGLGVLCAIGMWCERNG